MNRLFIFSVFIACSGISCSGDNSDDHTPLKPGFFVAEYSESMNLMQVVDGLYSDAQAMGSLQNHNLTEASGLAESGQVDSLLWSHNDSGDMNRLFLFSKSGAHKGVFRILGAGNRDWEDLASGPGPESGLRYIYIADVGDNQRIWPEVYLYRVAEPDVNTANPDAQWVDVPVTQVERFTVKYPDGPRDAETLLLDPWTLDLFVISKSDFPARVYRLAYPYEHNGQYTFEMYGTLPVTLLTGGDISPDGKRIVLKTKERIWEWHRNEDETLADAFMRTPTRVPYLPEPQGEAICYQNDGSAYLTLSEKGSSSLAPVIYRYSSIE